jgi:rhamnose transport system permease protein
MRLQNIRTFTHEILLGLVLLIVMILAWRSDATFVTSRSQQGLLSHVWDMAILSLPMTFIIITGGIDLSVGSTMALASVTLGMLHKAGCPIVPAAGLAVMVGLMCGLVNGVFITRIRVHPLIVTLATYSAFRGLAEGMSLPTIYKDFPQSFRDAGNNPLFVAPESTAMWALPPAGWFFLLAAAGCGLILAKTPFGRSVYAIGFNENAARYSGLRVNRIKMILYGSAGLAAGLVAVNYGALRNNAQASVGTGMELEAITAVVLGGTSIFGGRGRIIGTLLGVALIHETREFVGWYWNRSELVPLVLGSLLIISVAANALLNRKSSRGT